MPNNLGREKIPLWTQDIWDAMSKAVTDEHQRTTVAAQFLSPPVPDDTMNGTVAADTAFVGDDGILSVDESENRSIVEIAVQFRLREAQVDNETKMKTAESLATKAANLLARGEDLIIFQGLAALQDPLFKSKSVVLLNPKHGNSPVDSFLFAGNTQTITVEPAEPNSDPTLSIFGENTYAAVAKGYALLQEHHYGRQALVLPTTIYADTYATRTTTLDIPAITADRIKGLIGDFYGTSTLPALNDSSPAKGVLIARDGNTTDLVVQMAPTVAVVTQDSTSGDFVFKVYERFALRLKDPLAVVELDFVGRTKRPAKQ
jgi:Encapsulating protein for peroxidase